MELRQASVPASGPTRLPYVINFRATERPSSRATERPGGRAERTEQIVAVEVGFEPTESFHPHTLSRRARSATTRLHRGRA